MSSSSLREPLINGTAPPSSSWKSHIPLALTAIIAIVALIVGIVNRSDINSQNSAQASSSSSAVWNTFTLNMLPYDYGMYPYPSSMMSPYPEGVPLTVLSQQVGQMVTLQFPQFNFFTYSAQSPFNMYIYEQSNTVNPPPIPGGFLVSQLNLTSFPFWLIPQRDVTFTCASNDGLLNVPSPYGNQTGGSPFQLTVTSYGQVIISSSTTFNGVIPPGAHTFLSQTFTYSVMKTTPPTIPNFIVQEGFTNYTGLLAVNTTVSQHELNDAYRDSHVNDFYNGVIAYSWTSNADRPNKSDGAMDLYVSVGAIQSDGSVKWVVSRLTNMAANNGAWDTAVAINRNNTAVVMVSFGWIRYDTHTNAPYYFLSKNGGQTFNGPFPVNTQYYSNGVGFGDCRGVLADPFGNFWYSATLIRPKPIGTDNNAVWFSSDFGETFTLAYNSSDATNSSDPIGGTYDYPQMTFGVDSAGGRQGLWLSGDYYFNSIYAMVERIVFIPTSGLGKTSPPELVILPNIVNQVEYPALATSPMGHLFMLSSTVDYINWQPNRLTVKSPPQNGQSFLDPSLFADEVSIVNVYQNYYPSASYSDRDFFSVSIQDLEYDSDRGALYVILNERPDIFSQDYYLFLVCSKNFGATWGPRIPIASSHVGNRGFSSMARDSSTGIIAVQFYDGRNDPKFQSQQLMGAILTNGILDQIVTQNC